MPAESVRKMALARKPYRKSDLCNRSVPHAEQRLRSLDPFLQDVLVGRRARRLLEATAQMTRTQVHQLGQVVERQVAGKVGENTVQHAPKLWRRKTALHRPHQRAIRSVSFPGVAHQREGKRFSVKPAAWAAAEYLLVHTLQKGGHARVICNDMRQQSGCGEFFAARPFLSFRFLKLYCEKFPRVVEYNLVELIAPV